MEFLPKSPVLDFHPDTIEVVRKICDLQDGSMKQSIDILEQWVQKQEHFKKKDFGPIFYEVTIMACKGSVEKAKSQIDRFCTLRTLLPEYFMYFQNRVDIMSICEKGCAIPLPKMTNKYQRIFLIKFFDRPFIASNILDFYKLVFMVTQYQKMHEYCDGFIVVMDLTEARLTEILAKMSLIELQQFMTILIEGFGAKLKSLHIVNKLKVVELFAKYLKAVVSQKIANRLYVHHKLEDLYSFLDKELLPIDLGGSQKPLKELRDDWIDILSSEEFQKHLGEISDAQIDESLRDIRKCDEQIMGLPGSFRTLTVD